MKLNRTIATSLTALALSPLAVTLGNGIVTTQVVHADTIATNSTNDSEKTTYFTNRELFTVMENHGYDVKSAIGEKAYQAALVQDMMRAGGTYIKTNKHGFTIYINSALTKVIVAGGSVAVAGAVGWLLAEAGLGSAAVENAKNVILFVTSSAGSKAMSRGIWVRCSNKGNLVSWGYQ